MRSFLGVEAFNLLQAGMKLKPKGKAEGATASRVRNMSSPPAPLARSFSATAFRCAARRVRSAACRTDSIAEKMSAR